MKIARRGRQFSRPGWRAEKHLTFRIKSFAPCKNAEGDDQSKNYSQDQVALYIHVTEHKVNFFHNLNFR
jgi:hypothetical protein